MQFISSCYIVHTYLENHAFLQRALPNKSSKSLVILEEKKIFCMHLLTKLLKLCMHVAEKKALLFNL